MVTKKNWKIVDYEVALICAQTLLLQLLEMRISDA